MIVSKLMRLEGVPCYASVLQGLTDDRLFDYQYIDFLPSGIEVVKLTAQFGYTRENPRNKAFVVLMMGTPGGLSLSKSLVACMITIWIDYRGIDS